jgi:hypothetical protein
MDVRCTERSRRHAATNRKASDQRQPFHGIYTTTIVEVAWPTVNSFRWNAL